MESHKKTYYFPKNLEKTHLIAELYNMGHFLSNLSSVILAMYSSNRSPQLQRLAKILIFYMDEVKLLYFPDSELQMR